MPRLSPVQKRTALLMTLIGLVYFTALSIPNARGARNENMLRVFSGDETVTYPYVVRMLETPKDIHDLVFRLFIYGDYHYGYPFYFFSMLAVLPSRLLYGEGFTGHTQLNLLLLRQLISVLPMLLAAGVLTFLQTRFRSPGRSAALFILILAIPGVVRSGLWWWHPDGLAVLCAALTLLFLDLDHLRLGRWFLLAAAACGMSIAIKLIGFFFVFVLAGYVLATWLRHLRQARTGTADFCPLEPLPARTGSLAAPLPAFPTTAFIPPAFYWIAPTRSVLLRSLGFILVMALVVVLSNPFLFYASQRAKLVRIQAEKSQELSVGYAHDNPTYYQKGPRWWTDTLQKWYGPLPFLALLLVLAGAGSLWGKRKVANRLLLAWVIPYSLYLLYFVAVKPDHYWLPVLPALFSAALNGVKLRPAGKYRRWILAVSLLVVVVLAWQFLHFLQVDGNQYITILGQEAAKGY